MTNGSSMDSQPAVRLADNSGKMLPAKSVGASVFRVVFVVLPYGRIRAPTTGVSHVRPVGNRVANRILKAEFVVVPSGTETKSATAIPGWNSNTRPRCASALEARTSMQTPASAAGALCPNRARTNRLAPKNPQKDRRRYFYGFSQDVGKCFETVRGNWACPSRRCNRLDAIAFREDMQSKHVEWVAHQDGLFEPFLFHDLRNGFKGSARRSSLIL